MPNFQKNNQDNRKATSTSGGEQGLKRKMSDDDDSGDTTDSASWPTETVDSINFEVDDDVGIKDELMDCENAETNPPSPDGDVGYEDAVDVIDVIKTEPEDDPLHLNRGTNEFASKVEEATRENIKCCDEGFLPGTGENLPVLDTLAVTEFLATLPDYNRERTRVLWREVNNMIEDSIGYVQLRRDGKTCTVKCEVATKSTSNHCTVTYNEVSSTVQAASCDCGKTQCIHTLAALVWLSKPDKGPVTYWMMPMVSRDASSMKLNAIFGLPKISYQKKYTVLNEFIQKCAEKENFSPVLMKYYQVEVPTASLHRLMREYIQKYNHLDVEIFFDLCRKKISKDPIIKGVVPLSPKVIQELEYGRISDDLLWDASEATEDSARDLVVKIMYPQVRDPVKVKHVISHSLEMTLKMEITKCSMLISDTAPIYSASPYGVTQTHVVYFKKLEDAEEHISAQSGKTLSQKDTARMQLQMFLTKRECACYCEVLTDNQIVISILNYNEQWLIELLKKATKFWETHVFKQIMEKS